jgi:hypothetical protein
MKRILHLAAVFALVVSFTTVVAQDKAKIVFES